MKSAGSKVAVAVLCVERRARVRRAVGSLGMSRGKRKGPVPSARLGPPVRDEEEAEEATPSEGAPPCTASLKPIRAARSAHASARSAVSCCDKGADRPREPRRRRPHQRGRGGRPIGTTPRGLASPDWELRGLWLPLLPMGTFATLVTLPRRIAGLGQQASWGLRPKLYGFLQRVQFGTLLFHQGLQSGNNAASRGHIHYKVASGVRPFNEEVRLATLN